MTEKTLNYETYKIFIHNMRTWYCTRVCTIDSILVEVELFILE